MKHSFYEAVLVQDGHNLEHVIPPRDLQSWQQLPVSAIANFQPVVIPKLDTNEVQKVLKAHPYNVFPVLDGEKVIGLLSRTEFNESITEKRAPKLDTVVTCLPTDTIRNLQYLLIESPKNMVIILDREGGKAIGMVTLHDLLRAEVSIAKEGGG